LGHLGPLNGWEARINHVDLCSLRNTLW
jgi:hypothetical protein